MLIDEKLARRETFVEGSPVTLADGQVWTLPRPVVVYTPADTDLGFETRIALEDDGEFGKIMKALDNAENGAEIIKATLAVGRKLMLRNYDLTPDQLSEVLQFNYADEDSVYYKVREAVMAVAWGQGESLGKP